MPRPSVMCRPATAADVSALAALHEELLAMAGRAEKAVAPPAVSDVSARLAQLVDDPDCRVVLATVDGVAAGMVVARGIRADPLSDAESLHLFHLTVTRTIRHRGVGHALVKAASDFAVERGVEHVMISLYPSLREANRFFARLGFAPVGALRVAPTSSLRRRLGGAEHAARPSSEALRRRALVLRPAAAGRARREAARVGDRPTMPG